MRATPAAPPRRGSAARTGPRAAKVPLCQLLQTIVGVLARLGENPLDVGKEGGVAPVVAGGRLRAGGVALVRPAQQRTGRRPVVVRVGPVGKGVAAGRLTAPGVLVDEGSRHLPSISR